jgi:sirohydrochlorin ferrochelatase
MRTGKKKASHDFRFFCSGLCIPRSSLECSVFRVSPWSSTVSDRRIALLLIAHGSRRSEANADLDFIAAGIRERGRYHLVQVSYLELAEPGIETAGALCVENGATDVILLPYFLSPGVHVVEDLTAARNRLGERFPMVKFVLAEPLGRHPLLVDVVEERAREVEG